MKILCTSEKISTEKALEYAYIDSTFHGERQGIEEAVEFLQPYLDMPYPSAIKSIKLSVAAAEGYSRDKANEVATKLFSKRWGGSDNRDAYPGGVWVWGKRVCV